MTILKEMYNLHLNPIACAATLFAPVSRTGWIIFADIYPEKRKENDQG